MKWLLSLLTILVLVQPVYGQRAKYQAWCEQGGFQVQTQGQNSTTRVQRSFPTCTITVFTHGTTTRAMLFSTEQGAALANPFQNQDRNTGQYFFYAAIGRYDIQIAATGLTTFTLRDVIVGNGATGPPGPPGPQGPPGSGGGGGGDGKNCGLTAIAMTDIAECAVRNGGVAYPQWWGAKADGVILGGAMGGTGCNGTLGSAVITCPTGQFTASDVGKRADFAHAGTPQCGPSTWGRSDLLMTCNLVATIASVQSATQLTLSTGVLTTAPNEQFAYASSDDAAIQAALDSGIKNIAFVGIYGVTGDGTTYGNGVVGGTFVNRAITAPGPGVGRLLKIGPVAWDGGSGAMFLVENGSQHLTVDGLSFWGTNVLGELTQFGPVHDGLVVCSGTPNSALCSGFPGNVNGSITDIRFLNCDFSHSWGIGMHGPGAGPPGGPGVYDVRIVHSTANFNSYDGFNPNFSDGTILDGLIGSHNGTGGLEIATFGSLTVTNSIFTYNKTGGMAFGGYQGGGVNRTCRITSNDFSENGNGSINQTVGAGLIIGDGTQNCTVSGNTMRHNHYVGLELVMAEQDHNLVISNNQISTNGLTGGILKIGVYGSFFGVTFANNQIVNEAYARITSIGRTNNVVTVGTSTANHYHVGWTIYIGATPNKVFDTGDNPGTISSVINGATFTFTQPGPDIPVQHFEAGLQELGTTYSPTGGFNQREGLVVGNCAESDFTGNTVTASDFANVSFVQFLPGSPYVHCYFQSETNTIGYSVPSSDGARDLYLLSDVQGIGPRPLIPTIGGLIVNVPSIQTLSENCYTAAAPGATCTVTFGHGFNDDLAYMLDGTPQALTRTKTTCTIDPKEFTPGYIVVGHPVVLEVRQLDFYRAVATIGTYDGQQAGGGTLKCISNFNY